MVCAVISNDLICHLLELILIFVWLFKEVKWHGNITYPYLAVLGRVVARNFGQHDLSWHVGSVRGSIFVLNF